METPSVRPGRGGRMPHGLELRAEERLLLACLREQVRPERAQPTREPGRPARDSEDPTPGLDSGRSDGIGWGGIEGEAFDQDAFDQDAFDWDRFLALVRRHAVLPLVYRSLAARLGRAPADVLATLRRQFQLNVGSSYALTTLLLELLALFEQEGITAIPFKGPSLAVAAYGDLALRPFSDLDVFVPRADVPRAARLLTDRGFRLVQPERLDEALARSGAGYHYTLSKDGGTLIVELHWGIAPWFIAFRMDDAHWWRTDTTVQLLGRQVPRFALEDALLLLCVHGSRHVWDRLGWICDVAMVIRNETLDWAALFRRARRLGSQRMVLLGLLLAHRLLDAPLPPQVLLRIERDRAVPRLAAAVQRNLFASGPALAVNKPWYLMRLHVKPRHRLRLLMHEVRGKLGGS